MEARSDGDGAGTFAGEVERLKEQLRELGRLKSLRDPFAQALEGFGLSPPQLHAVLWLREEKHLTMGVLARRLGITEKTVTGLVDRLESAGLCARDRDPIDRRIVHVVLTAEGRELAERLDAEFTQRLGWLVSVLDETERAVMFRIIEKVRTKLAAIDPKAGGQENR